MTDSARVNLVSSRILIMRRGSTFLLLRRPPRLLHELRRGHPIIGQFFGLLAIFACATAEQSCVASDPERCTVDSGGVGHGVGGEDSNEGDVLGRLVYPLPKAPTLSSCVTWGGVWVYGDS